MMRYGVVQCKNCVSIFSKTVKDRVMKFSAMIDISIGVCNFGLSIPLSFAVRTSFSVRVDSASTCDVVVTASANVMMPQTKPTAVCDVTPVLFSVLCLCIFRIYLFFIFCFILTNPAF